MGATVCSTDIGGQCTRSFSLFARSRVETLRKGLALHVSAAHMSNFVKLVLLQIIAFVVLIRAIVERCPLTV